MRITKTIRNYINWIFSRGHSCGIVPRCHFDPPTDYVFFPIDHTKHKPHTWLNADLLSWLSDRKHRIVIHRRWAPNYFSIYDIELKFFYAEDAVAFKLAWC